MKDDFPNQARIVVIGGGVIGASIAYHLAKSGERDVVLLEKSALSAGTTWHSAGNMETYRADPLLFEIVRYGVSLFPKLEEESGQLLGWRTTGRVMYTHLPQRMEEYKAVPRLAEARGIEVSVLGAKELEEKFPILDVKPIVGGLWIPNDGRVNPTDLTMAFARAAKKNGAKIVENCPVISLKKSNGRITGVSTRSGEIACEKVVVAAGLWSNDITGTAGVRLPLHALEHFYIITKDMPEVPRDLPMFLAFDDLLYGREEVGGMIIGCLDRNAIPIATKDLPTDFSFGLLQERWDQFEPYMETALSRFPALQKTEIRMFLNGPESFTPDAQILIGPTPEVEGLYVATGMNSNGIALSSGVGRLMSEWIIDGRPSMDVSRLDVRRFGQRQTSEDYMRKRVIDIPSYFVGMHGPGDDPLTARDIRHSPLHGLALRLGAKFKSVCAWERAVWFVPKGAQLSEFDIVKQESCEAQTKAALIDRSADVKYLIGGDGAEELISNWALEGMLNEEGKAKLTPLFDGNGRVTAMPVIVKLAGAQWFVTAPPEQETFLAERLEKIRAENPDVIMSDVTEAYILLRVIGPRRGGFLQNLATHDAETASPSPILSARVGAVPIQVFEDVDAPAAYILAPSESAGSLETHLETAVSGGDIVFAGHFAEEAFRIGEGLPAWGRELSVHADVSPADFRCFQNFTAPPNRTGDAKFRVLCAFAEIDLPADSGLDPILCGDRPVGWVTSAAYDPALGKSHILARVDADVIDEDLDLLIGEKKSPLRRRC